MADAISAQQVEVRPEPTKLYRWIVLVFVSLAMFGNYYFYDALEPLAKLLQEQLHFTDSNIGLLNTAYSIAPFFTVVIGGIIIDLIGTRKSMLIFGTLCLAGAVITASSPKVLVMALGRMIFGMGAESLIVAITTAVAKWFKGKELSFALGINLMIARGGTWMAQNSPTWARSAYDSWQKPWWIGVGFVTLCVIGPVAYYFLEVRAERNSSLGQAGEQDKIVLSDVKKFGVSYWYLVGLCVVFYSAIFPFETFAVKYFVDAHGASLQSGGALLSVLTTFTMIGTPIVGLYSDKMGRRATIMVLGTLLLIPVFLLMAYTNVSLSVPMAVLGFAFTLVPAIIWPSVAYIVEARALGTALGLMTMVQNFGMAGMNWVLGAANDAGHAGAQNPKGYLLMLWILTGMGVVGFVFALLLRQREVGPHGHGLETIRAGK
ncbi:MAG TPA: MFS transporter [Candidatus Acidoferrales bacterium]|nr:MFS transporter [Candidatus Acidoferrales bacterium]